MTVTTETRLPFETIIGRWKTSGTVLAEDGNAVATIDGTDEYGTMTAHLDAAGPGRSSGTGCAAPCGRPRTDRP